ncbi:MAG: hypothetical protein EPO08_09185 [Rhodospirillaceae bacterium]|nr:MAG: hypothetical protein EPO08_09185 [Rhodospirillaceae bacterium]
MAGTLSWQGRRSRRHDDSLACARSGPIIASHCGPAPDLRLRFSRYGPARPTAPPSPPAHRIDPDDEAEHILTCLQCGQSFDVRDDREVGHHAEPGHQPLPRS